MRRDEFLLDKAGVPEDLTGLSVLDIGTTNGGLAFEAERRGASSSGFDTELSTPGPPRRPAAR